MKNVFLFWVCALFATSTFGQENPAVTEKLKKMYDYVKFESVYDANPSEPRDYFYRVNKNEKYGACDIHGKEIIPTRYKYVNLDKTYRKPCHYFFKVNTDEHHNGLYDEKGNLIIKPEYDHILIEDGYFLILRGGKYGICNLLGKEVIPPIWDFVSCEESGYSIVYDGEVGQQGTKMGLYNPEGKQILPCKFEWIYFHYKYKDVIFPQTEDFYFGMIDKNGKQLLRYEYSGITLYDTLGIVITAKGGKHNEKGLFYNPLNAKWGIATIQGKQIVPCEYEYIGEYSEGLFLCNKGGFVTDNDVEGGLWGYLDVKGNLVVPCQYESASNFEDGVAQVTLNGVSSLLTNPLTGTNLQLANGGAATKVDANIPKTGRNADNTFAFIFANENYSHLSGADFSINDGKIFKEYCQKTIGIPEKNIRYFEDATFGNIVSAVQKIKDIADVYDGDAKIIFYYSGLGISGKNKERYILPIDASLDALNTTGYSVETLMQTLNALNTESTLVILDAPFSGTDKNGKMLAQHRGVQIAPKPVAVSGNTILCVSSNQTETAHSDKKYGHSLFTYALLEKLHSSKGSCTIKEAIDHATQWVKRESMSNYDKAQTPIVEVSEKKTTVWNHLKW